MGKLALITSTASVAGWVGLPIFGVPPVVAVVGPALDLPVVQDTRAQGRGRACNMFNPRIVRFLGIL